MDGSSAVECPAFLVKACVGDIAQILAIEPSYPDLRCWMPRLLN